MSAVRRLLGAALGSTALLATLASGALAQDGPAAACDDVGTDLGYCRTVALGAEQLLPMLVLAVEGGNPVPGTASTLGMRLATMPRWSLGGRFTVASGTAPDLVNREGTNSRELMPFVLAVDGSVGVLPGWNPASTVGGVGSLDVLYGAAIVPFVASDDLGAFGGWSWGAGARVGLLRESFTLPGVTVSVARHGAGDVQLGDRGAGDQIQVDLDPGITSVRALIGKDLLALGILVGVGWDRYAGDATLQVAGASGPVTVSGFEATRRLYFGGASVNLLLLQLSTELGWAGGFDPLAARHPDGYDPTGGSLFLSIAARLTL